MLKRRVVFEKIIFVTLIMFLCFIGLGENSVNSSIVGASVLQGSTQLELPKGCELYVYGMSTGGGLQSNPFVNGKTISVTNIDGLISAELSVSTSNINEFTTGTSYYAIGGFGINDVEYIEGFYGTNQGPGQGSGPGVETASVNFTLSTPATVVVIGMASSQQSITFSGINNLYTDIPSPNTGGTVAISIAHAYLGTGTYTIQENSSATVGGQDPNNQADLIGVLICSDEPLAASSSNPQIPIPILAISSASETSNATILTPTFSFELNNGTIFTGEFLSDSINSQNPFFSAKISIYGIKSINNNSNGTFTIVLKDGSKIIAKIRDSEFSIKTVFSPNMTLEWNSIKDIELIK